MQLGRVVGTVVCTRKVDGWRGERLRLVEPLSVTGKPSGKLLVALDTVSADEGQKVFFVRGREAAHSIADTFQPADAAIVALVDRLESGA